MKNIINLMKNNKMIIIVFLLTILTLIIPNFQKQLVLGDDCAYHLARTQSLADSMRNKVFFTKINATMANNFGYASAMFYPDLLLYIPALIVVIFNTNIIFAYKIFVFIFLVFMFFMFYKCLFYITENKYASLFGTAFLMLSKVLIVTLYFRFALGEFLAFAFILPAITGIYDYIYKDFKSPSFIIIGFFGLLNTHLITGLIVLAFCLILFLINIKVTIKDYKRFLKLILSAIVVLLLSIYFWLPVIEQTRYQQFKFSVPWTAIQYNTYTIADYLWNGTYTIGISALILLPIQIYLLLSKKSNKNAIDFFIYFIVLSIILVSNYFWVLFKDYVGIIQFRWRLLGLITTIFTISISLTFKEISNSEDKKIEDIIKIICVILILLTINNFYYNGYITRLISNKDVYEDIYQHSISLGLGAEYLPKEIKDSKFLYSLNSESSFKDSKMISDNEIIGTKYPNSSFEVEVESGKEYQIPFVYYYGYVANITDKNGEVRSIEVSKNDNGFVRVSSDNELEGKIRVWYNGTKLQKISLLISAFTFLTLASYIIIKKIRKR